MVTLHTRLSGLDSSRIRIFKKHLFRGSLGALKLYFFLKPTYLKVWKHTIKQKEIIGEMMEYLLLNEKTFCQNW